jgi:hypothetical protein
MSERTIALLTDFGLIDPYVGLMHGVITGIAPRTRVVDLCHHINPQDVHEAGEVLADSFRYFPAGTIYVAVIDPGVGSERRIIGAAVEDQIVIAPDNGLATALFDELPPTAVHHVMNKDMWLKSVSQTFHGRDIFAPTAAYLAAGAELAAVGPRIDQWQQLDLPRTSETHGGVDGQITRIDRFGNLITNIRGTQMPVLPTIEVSGHVLKGLVRSYTEVQPGEPAAIVGSTGRLEIVVNQGSAAQHFHVDRGGAVRVRSRLGEGTDAAP